MSVLITLPVAIDVPETLIIAVLAQALPPVPPHLSSEWQGWLFAIGIILSALSPVMLAIVAAWLKIKLARIERKSEETSAKIDHQTEQIEEAKVMRKEIAQTQSRQIDTMAKSGPQQVVVANREPIPVQTEEGRHEH